VQEPRTWREFLSKIIEDPKEKQRIAEEVGINERTLDRWATGLSNPRSSSHIRQLLKALPHHREVLAELLHKDYPDDIDYTQDEQDIFIDEVIKDIPIPFYTRVLETYVTAVEPIRAWSICNLILQQMTRHLDFDHQGITVTLTQCVLSPQSNKVHKLRQLFKYTKGQGLPESHMIYYGIESLSGLAVIKGVPQIGHITSCNNHASPPSSPNIVAYPVQRAGSVAGSLVTVSPQNDFFTPARLKLIQHYVHLLALAFQEHEYFAPAAIELYPMPPESAQQQLMHNFYERAITVFNQSRLQGQPLTWAESEQHIYKEIEAALDQTNPTRIE
jgi:hypothetical protein